MSRCPECGMKECCGADYAPRLETLEAENAALRSQFETAMDDGERAISTVLKLELDLKCLEDSTVDAKAFEQLKAENAALRDKLDRFRNANCANCGAGPSTPGKEQKG